MKKREAAILCLAGAGLLTMVGVAYALTKPKPPPTPPPPETIPPPEEFPPPPAIPAMIQVESAPTSMIQNIIWRQTANGHTLPGGFPWLCCLRHSPIWGYENGQIVYGHRAYNAYFRVVDAAGKGVPNVPILVWSTPTRDDQGGIFAICGKERSFENPLRVLTDADGRINLFFEYYETYRTLEILDERHDFGCYIRFPGAWDGRGGDIKPEECCGKYLGLYWTLPHYGRAKTADTEPRTYIVHLEVEGAPRVYNEIGVMCRFHSEALWD